MKILVIGRNGMIGNGIFEYLSEEYNTYGTLKKQISEYSISSNRNIFEGIDLTSISTIENLINRLEPNVVINCSGIIKQKSKDYSDEEHLYLNAKVPHLLLEICLKKDVRLINLSTDCVFDGKKGFYNDLDTPNAIDIYGTSKAIGEITKEGCLTIRTSTIGLEVDNNHGLIEWFLSQKGKEIRGYDNAIYSGLTIKELTRYIEHILINFPELNGLYNMASERISKYDLLSILARKIENFKILINKDSEFFCDRSLNGEALDSITGFKVKSWEKMLSDLALDINKRE
tara:strand:+ start:3235 stop:4095 length:861 start_codon:yes stop_codon:yes gene_type:complete